MRNVIMAMGLLTGTFLTVSCNSDNKSEQQTTEAVATPGEAVIGGDSVLNDDQKELFSDIARHNLFQIELGRLATQKGSSETVKQYGQRMVDLYTSKQQELKEMAQTYQITLEQEIYEEYRDDMDDVKNAKQNKFDEEYWDNAIDAQEELLGEYNDVLKDVAATDASAFTIWARTSMKELRAQMEQAMANDKQRRDGM